MRFDPGVAPPSIRIHKGDTILRGVSHDAINYPIAMSLPKASGYLFKCERQAISIVIDK